MKQSGQSVKNADAFSVRAGGAGAGVSARCAFLVLPSLEPPASSSSGSRFLADAPKMDATLFCIFSGFLLSGSTPILIWSHGVNGIPGPIFLPWRSWCFDILDLAVMELG